MTGKTKTVIRMQQSNNNLLHGANNTRSAIHVPFKQQDCIKVRLYTARTRRVKSDHERERDFWVVLSFK